MDSAADGLRATEDVNRQVEALLQQDDNPLPPSYEPQDVFVDMALRNASRELEKGKLQRVTPRYTAPSPSDMRKKSQQLGRRKSYDRLRSSRDTKSPNKEAAPAEDINKREPKEVKIDWDVEKMTNAKQGRIQAKDSVIEQDERVSRELHEHAEQDEQVPRELHEHAEQDEQAPREPHKHTKQDCNSSTEAETKIDSSQDDEVSTKQDGKDDLDVAADANQEDLPKQEECEIGQTATRPPTHHNTSSPSARAVDSGWSLFELIIYFGSLAIICLGFGLLLDTLSTIGLCLGVGACLALTYLVVEHFDTEPARNLVDENGFVREDEAKQKQDVLKVKDSNTTRFPRRRSDHEILVAPAGVQPITDTQYMVMLDALVAAGSNGELTREVGDAIVKRFMRGRPSYSAALRDVCWTVDGMFSAIMLLFLVLLSVVVRS